MTGPEQGFLLLTSSLGDPGRKPLTVAQFRNLTKRMADADRVPEPRDLEVSDLEKLGYDGEMAQRIYGLLCGTNLLREYVKRAENCDCFPITRLSSPYPRAVRQRLGLDSPGVLWVKGDVTLMNYPAIAVIGSRELKAENKAFAEEAGRQIAKQGYVLVSGNARGADTAAQEACLKAGGHVISIVADNLQEKSLRQNVLYLSLDSFDAPFSAQRALHRNYVIHTMAELVIAAQCAYGKGGTWDGILANIKNGWNPVCIYDDGSKAAEELQNRGTRSICDSQLADLPALAEQPQNFMNL